MSAEDWYELLRAYVMFPDVTVRPDMTIEEWEFEAFDIDMDYLHIRSELENLFHASIPAGPWNDILANRKAVSLGELCHFLATCGGHKPVIEPIQIGGRLCRPAAVFLTLRAVMQQRSGDAMELMPSTRLFDLSDKQGRSLVEAVWMIDPVKGWDITLAVEKPMPKWVTHLALSAVCVGSALISWIITLATPAIHLLRWAYGNASESIVPANEFTLRDLCYQL